MRLREIFKEVQDADPDDAVDERERHKQERRSRGRALSRLIERSRKVKSPTAASVADECADPTKTDP